MGGRATVLRGGLGHSSSEPPGVVGMSVLEQADMLVREGVGERVRFRDEGRWSGGGRGGVRYAEDVSLTGEAGSDAGMSRIISNVLRRTDRCICFMDDDGSRDAMRDWGLGHSFVTVEGPRTVNLSLP